MSHADTAVRSVHEYLRASGFMVSKCIVIREDDPLGNFGIAWYFGIYDGCGHMSFDEGYLPTQHTIVHEFGHDMHARWQTSGILEGFWDICGFGLTYEEAYAAGDGTPYQQWRRTPAEMFADVFAWVVLGDWVQTEMFGVALSDNLRARLTTYLKSFTEEEDVALTDADKAWLSAAINSRVGAAEVNILREVTDKLNAGFNTSVPTFIDRQSDGDKNVATAPVD